LCIFYPKELSNVGILKLFCGPKQPQT